MTSRVGNAASARRSAESAKYLRMDDAKARTGKHRNRQLRDHRQVEGDTVASLDAAKIAEQCGELIDPDIEFLIGDGFDLFRFRLGYPDQSRLVVTGFQVAIDAVVTNVEPTADKPLPKRRVAGVQRRMPIVVPGEQICVFLVAFRKVLLTKTFKNTRIACICLSNKLWTCMKILLLSPVNSDL
jgi:hypothetical protein